MLEAGGDERFEVDRSRLGLGGVGARERQEPVDETREPLDLGERCLEVALPAFVHVPLEVLEAQPERGQRRAQLVRGVGDELLLRVEQCVEPRHRLVELGGNGADFRRALLRCAGIEIARADGSGGLLERRQRLRQRPREAEPDEGRSGKHDPADRGQQQPVVRHA